MIRGIAEPMVAVYTACFLARLGHEIDPNEKEYLFLLMDFCIKILNKAMREGNDRCESQE
jgi:hypothetical protein